MTLDLLQIALFTLAATSLLGSPGPGIAALLAVGRERGFAAGLRFFGGLQIGLALACGISAAGLASVVLAVPAAKTALTWVAVAYLVWLAYQIAASPVGQTSDKPKGKLSAFTATGGFLLGASNPKAYLAFVSLMGSYVLVASATTADAILKWALCVAVIFVVDVVWLWIGHRIGRISLSPGRERAMNLTMGGLILGAAVLSLI